LAQSEAVNWGRQTPSAQRNARSKGEGIATSNQPRRSGAPVLVSALRTANSVRACAMHAALSGPAVERIENSELVSGEYEVYVQPVPLGEASFRFRERCGTQPRWRRDGSELFFASREGKLMAVPVKSGAGLEFGNSHESFDGVPVSENIFTYAVAKDGQRFLMSVPPQQNAGVEALNVLLNWQSALM